MSASSVLQGIMNSYMTLSRTDKHKLATDMSLAMNPQEKAFMPKIAKVQKIVFCSEQNITPHISVYFISEDNAEYCWDLFVKVRKVWDIDSSEPSKKYDFFGSLSLMRMPSETTNQFLENSKETYWKIDN